MLTDEKKRELELFFLGGVRERIALDVAATERGGAPRKWEGKEPPTREELELLRQHLRNIEAAIHHVQTGGNLEHAPYILWGQAPPP